MKIKNIEDVEVGEMVGTPGDHKIRTHWGVVHKLEKNKASVTLYSRDWATESNKKYGDGFGVYFARYGQKVKVK